MENSCKGCGFIGGILLILVSMWPNLMGSVANKWIVFAVGIIMLLGSIGCKSCANCEYKMAAQKPVKKSKKK
jgi:hypothetical protein